MEQVIEEFKEVKKLPNFGKDKPVPQANRAVLKVYTLIMQM